MITRVFMQVGHIAKEDSASITILFYASTLSLGNGLSRATNCRGLGMAILTASRRAKSRQTWELYKQPLPPLLL